MKEKRGVPGVLASSKDLTMGGRIVAAGCLGTGAGAGAPAAGVTPDVAARVRCGTEGFGALGSESVVYGVVCAGALDERRLVCESTELRKAASSGAMDLCCE